MLISFQLEIYDNAYDACNYVLKWDAENPKANELLKKIELHNLPKANDIERILKSILSQNQ